jgi:hypothetical protein
VRVNKRFNDRAIVVSIAYTHTHNQYPQCLEAVIDIIIYTQRCITYIHRYLKRLEKALVLNGIPISRLPLLLCTLCLRLLLLRFLQSYHVCVRARSPVRVSMYAYTYINVAGRSPSNQTISFALSIFSQHPRTEVYHIYIYIYTYTYKHLYPHITPTYIIYNLPWNHHDVGQGPADKRAPRRSHGA